MAALTRWLLALASGAVWGLCFGERVLLVAPWLALAPLIVLAGQHRAWVLGWAHGMAFWLVSIPWIVPTLENYGALPGWLAVASLLLLASYLALFSALFLWLASSVWKRSMPALVLFAIPAAWVIVEWLRGFLFTGFPWNLAAYAWVDLPGALPLSSWIGPWGVSFLLVLANTAIALAVAQRRWRSAVVAVGMALVVLAVAARWAAPAAEGASTPRKLSVQLLQPNIDILSQWDPERIEAQYQQVLAMSRAACVVPGSLVIWPESAAWPYSFSDDERLRRDLSALAARGCPLLMNTSMADEGGAFNSLLLVDEGGAMGRYDKRHLVPFGEYVPLSGWLPFLKKIARLAGEFLSGQDVGLLRWQGQLLAPAICFEITFPHQVAEQIRAGGTLLVTVTNDAWYGDTWAPWQHFRAARFRAAENRRYLLRVAITGVSAVIRSDGSIEDLLSVGERGVLTAVVPGERRLSLFTRAPWLVPNLCLLVTVFAILRGRKGRRS